mmetsp:Transcript_12927/g.26816  ORF Transcript_12927/g.26816 Transcript_12927/m.26816 type:complete len:108 (-) Transcript_12927:923-1246(-)
MKYGNLDSMPSVSTLAFVYWVEWSAITFDSLFYNRELVRPPRPTRNPTPTAAAANPNVTSFSFETPLGAVKRGSGADAPMRGGTLAPDAWGEVPQVPMVTTSSAAVG